VDAADPGDLGEVAISVATLAELHFGLLTAPDAALRARRARRLTTLEAAVSALPADAVVMREWGRLAAAVAARGGRRRRLAMDLVIAATATVHGVPLLTLDRDLLTLADLVDVRPL
jgi:hypothetical protein